MKKGGVSNVTIPNVFQSNGVIHVVDTVVLPNWKVPPISPMGAPDGRALSFPIPDQSGQNSTQLERPKPLSERLSPVTMLCDVATHPAADRSRDERSWFELTDLLSKPFDRCSCSGDSGLYPLHEHRERQSADGCQT